LSSRRRYSRGVKMRRSRDGAISVKAHPQFIAAALASPVVGLVGPQGWGASVNAPAAALRPLAPSAVGVVDYGLLAPQEVRRTGRVLMGVGGLFLVATIVAAVITGNDHDHLIEVGKQVTGRVTSVSQGSDTLIVSVDAAAVPDSAAVHHQYRLSSDASSFAVGDAITVYVDPNNPNRTAIDGEEAVSTRAGLLMFAMLMVFGVCSCIGLVMLLRARRLDAAVAAISVPAALPVLASRYRRGGTRTRAGGITSVGGTARAGRRTFSGQTGPASATEPRSGANHLAGYGDGCAHSPRPCVAAMILEPSDESVRSFTDALGSAVPKRDHEVAAPPPAAAVYTPRSVASTR